LIAKRGFDFVSSLLGLLILAPLFGLIALWIKLESPGPVFFRQERVGLQGRLFRIHKFRTMRVAVETQGPQITIGADPRITRAGAFLRKHKLDELAQLIDVLSGRMSLVGPRPEVPRYIGCYPGEVRAKVLSVRPGITDWASLHFKEESTLLAAAREPERAYIEQVLPIKQKYYLEYVERRSFSGDIKILISTVTALFGRSRLPSTAR